ncbi:MAG TPA: nucleotidyltransferase domain-containing protein [Firmicutes bacterium]|uniref:nucleotidyltransferase family protein n=1 Tax=Gelria sp. Kuro-4 TaxID=2796927 RepID=UPI0019AC25C4|nr:nucleotidyltransferase domain-containing protein [Gelria sp. Kuro-4]MDK2927545.1 hypothetical protein [Bacillota bacterium]BCV25955.1 hypothetical protein kuro4_27280 [Gelria sp. Kuro-4]HHV58050.1 nucleotidyltransferase domain-containing protein [Bacillota bacterium]
MPSVKIIAANEPEVRRALRQYVASLKKRQEVKAVYLCGSWARGRHSPYSDVDLLVLLSAGDQRRPFDRVPDYLPARFPVSLDLFIYTKEELARNEFAQNLLATGIPL